MPVCNAKIRMLTHKWSRQNKDVASEGKGMHMSDAISAAFCDLSEISCHWAWRHSLLNSARDCHVPDASVTVSPCLRARETYLNKWAQASLAGDGNTVLNQEDFWQGCPPRPTTRHHSEDAADMWIHSRLTQSFTQESKAKSDLHHTWRTYDGSKLICDAWLKQCSGNKGILDTWQLQLLCTALQLQRLRANVSLSSKLLQIAGQAI